MKDATNNAVGMATLWDNNEKFVYLFSKLMDAVEVEDWDEAASLIKLNEVLMAPGLERVYHLLPDEYKFRIPVECYTHHGDHLPTVRKYVRQARKLLPMEKRLPPELLRLPAITVYRAGEEAPEEAVNRISWTTSPEVALWFYNRAKLIRRPRRLYRGTIIPERIIWYTDGRSEKEVMQYRGVKQIAEIDPDDVPREVSAAR